MSRVPVKATRQVRPDEGETNDTRWAAIHFGSAGTPVGLRPALSLAGKAKTVQSDYAMPVHPGNVGSNSSKTYLNASIGRLAHNRHEGEFRL